MNKTGVGKDKLRKCMHGKVVTDYNLVSSVNESKFDLFGNS